MTYSVSCLIVAICAACIDGRCQDVSHKGCSDNIALEGFLVVALSINDSGFDRTVQ
jgi:hypothetical protein